jgi:hypothetical protein
MDIKELIKNRIARRKMRKAIMKRISINDNQIIIDAELIVKGNITMYP